MVDDEVRKLVRLAIRNSHGRAVTLAEALDDLGLLHTKQREKTSREGVLNIFEMCFEDEEASKILHWFYGEVRPCTSAEMWTAIQAWLLDVVRQQRRLWDQ